MHPPRIRFAILQNLMKIPAAIVVLLVSVWCVSAQPYQDLHRWGEQDSDNYRQFVVDLRRAHNGREVAAALKQNALRQKRAADQLLILIHAHPELRNVPELGLDPEGLEIWSNAHGTPAPSTLNVPDEVRQVQRTMRASNCRFDGDGAPQPVDILRKYRSDSDVVAAAQNLDQTMADNRRKLLQVLR